MKSIVSEGRLVTIHYRLSTEDGTVVEDTFDEEPVVYEHGAGQVVPGLERGLVGLGAGDERRLSVKPEQAYGLRDASAEKSVPRADFPPGEELSPGMSFRARGPEGAISVWVQAVDGDSVTITSNHPLAGVDLIYDVKVLDVQLAPAADQGPGET